MLGVKRGAVKLRGREEYRGEWGVVTDYGRRLVGCSYRLVPECEESNDMRYILMSLAEVKAAFLKQIVSSFYYGDNLECLQFEYLI